MRWSDTEAIGLFEEIKNGRNVTDNYGRLIWNYTNRGNSWRDREMVGLLEKIRNGTDVAANYGRAYWNYQRRGNGWAERTISSVLSQLQTASAVPPAPTNSVIPVVTGNNWEGQTLSTTNGTWTNSPTSYTYQWTADGTNIGGATSSTYVLATGQAEKVVRCVVTAHNAGGTGNATSDPTPTVAGNPLTIFGADLVAWYDPSDASTITQSSGLVSKLADKSRHGYDMTAAGAARPAYSATAFQSHVGGLTFNGSSTSMLATHVAMGVSTFACFCFSQHTLDLASFPQRLTQFLGDNNTDGDETAHDISASLLSNDGNNPTGICTKHNTVQTNSDDTLASSPATARGRIYSGNYLRMGVVDTGAAQKLYVDGLLNVTGVTSGTLDTAGLLSLGSRYTGVSGFWNGTVGEYVLVKRVPSASDIGKLDAWFLRHWTRVVVCEGDSVTWAPLISTSIGFPYRFIPNSNPQAFVMDLAIPGTDFERNAGACLIDRKATTYAAVPSSKYGKKYILFFTFANQIGTLANGSSDAAQYAADMVTYAADAKATGNFDKVLIATALDRTDLEVTAVRNAFNAIVKNSAWSGLVANGGSIDAVVDFASATHVGVDNAPDVNPTYFLDQVHPNALGHTELEPIFTAVLNSV